MASGVQGLDQIITRLNAELKQIKGASAKGLVKAAIHIRRETEYSPPLTPVDIGNLRASFFIATANGSQEDPISDSGKFKNKKGHKDIAGKMSRQHKAVLSAAITEIKAQQEPMVITGYSANYAAAVHEKIGANFQRPSAGPKWFEAAFKRNKKKVVEIVANETKIP